MPQPIYRILSALLSYPQPELIDALPEISQALQAEPAHQAALQDLLEHLRQTPLLHLTGQITDPSGANVPAAGGLSSEMTNH